ncbi:ETC complex I subunit [Novacetimonas cocois]|uniref:NADH-ubiquinone oxidoreductase n=1 Tax=Novacetimonas cocois TaxID=1747507 RepID=A0A365Z184_9PROT|nr:ETC complex I subunit [Novacetimonas cocois]RBM09741.1 NADH-ubiquinone oxidoreductase [Novacetimonas cocois]
MRARVYQESKTATQSGQVNTHTWVLEYGQTQPRHVDTLMGWTGSRDTLSQVRLLFPSQEAAVAYATHNGIGYDLELPVPRIRKPKAYADNFRCDRIQNWTH